MLNICKVVSVTFLFTHLFFKAWKHIYCVKPPLKGTHTQKKVKGDLCDTKITKSGILNFIVNRKLFDDTFYMQH